MRRRSEFYLRDGDYELIATLVKNAEELIDDALERYGFQPSLILLERIKIVEQDLARVRGRLSKAQYKYNDDEHYLSDLGVIRNHILWLFNRTHPRQSSEKPEPKIVFKTPLDA